MAYQGYNWNFGFSDGTFTDITKIDGVKLEVDVIELKTNSLLGHYTRKKLPGRMKSGSITLTRALPLHDNSSTIFADWIDDVLQNGLSHSRRKSGTMKLIGPQNDTVVEFSFVNAWPATWTAGQLDPNNPDSQLESIELAHDGLARIK